MLFKAGADLDLEDYIGTKPRDIISNPGPVSATDALLHLGITQREVRQIERRIHPEMYINKNYTHGEGGKRGAEIEGEIVGERGGAGGVERGLGWTAGTGGWGTERLSGYETDMACDIDQYWSDEISDEEVFAKYLARGAPVLIRGLIEDWPVREKYTHDALKANHGALSVQVRVVVRQ